MANDNPFGDPILYNDWHVVAIVDRVNANQPLWASLLGEGILLWQAKDKIVACQDRCSYRGVSLLLGEINCNGEIVCSYHAMSVDATGQSPRIPADLQVTISPQNTNLWPYKAQSKYGFVWISLGEPIQEILTFAEWEQENATTFQCGPYPISAIAPRIVENFVDIAHFSFTYHGLLGNPVPLEMSNYTLSVSAEEITASDIYSCQPNLEGIGEAKSVSYLYKIVRSLSACFCRDRDQYFPTFLAVTLLEETRSIAWLSVSRNYSSEVSNDELRAFHNKVMVQDVSMVESQSPQRLLLDLQKEFHFLCDKMSIAYRKWLKYLGLQFGTC